jgi:hypothetical protein
LAWWWEERDVENMMAKKAEIVGKYLKSDCD